MNNEEITTILLALRLLQLSYNEQARSYDLPPQLQVYLQEGEILPTYEIDRLCDDINRGSFDRIEED